MAVAKKKDYEPDYTAEAEYYFEYIIREIRNDLDLKEKPLLRVERDYKDSDMKYVLYLVLPQVYARGDGVAFKADEIPFNSIAIRYDKNGIIPKKLVEANVQRDGRFKNSGKVEVDFCREMFLGEYARHEQLNNVNNQILKAEPKTMCMGGYRINLVTSSGFHGEGIKNSKEDDLSGVGKITLYRQDEPSKKTEYYIAVNFGFKRKISYIVEGDKITFKGRKICDRIPIKILYVKDRYPCLSSDHMLGTVTSRVLNFKGKSEDSVKIDSKYKGYKVYVTFDSDYEPASADEDSSISYEELSKFYLLECLRNDTLNIDHSDHKRPPDVQFCPYCHRKMSTVYKRGGSHCQETASGVIKKAVTIKDVNKKNLAKKVIWCEKEINPGSATANFDRVLPDNYLNRRNFKIAVLGSGRSGKTTFISRLFNVTRGRNSFKMNTEVLQKVITERGKLCKITDHEIKRLCKSDSVYYESNDAWCNENSPSQFYKKYVINLPTGEFPKATDKRGDKEDAVSDTFKYPFILNVNSANYISIYDIAGEDVEGNRDRVTQLFEDAPVGIFYVINGEMDASGAEEVRRSIEQIFASIEDVSSCPVAVIVSKFDRLEHEFDKNCYCLRSDTADVIDNNYEGSALQRSIDMASEEILAYLDDKGLNPFKGIDKLNVKYFSVSSFSAPDSIYHKDSTGGNKADEVNYLKYLSSPKRMELPIIWMLRQFGCIV